MGIFPCKVHVRWMGELTIPIILIWMLTLFQVDLICEFAKYRGTVCSEVGGGGGTSCLIFATWKQYGNFLCCSQFPFPLHSRGISQTKGKCIGERNVEGFIHQMAISRTLGLDWQLSLPHKAHCLLGKERPTVIRLTWSLCPLSCSSQPLNQIPQVFSFGLHQTLLSFCGSLLCLDWFQRNFLVTVTKT